MDASPGIEKVIRFLSNNLDEFEQRVVRDWINAKRENQLEFNRIADVWAAYKKEQKVDVDVENDWKIILSRIDNADLKPISWWKTVTQSWVYRAAAILVIGVGIWILKPGQKFSRQEVTYISSTKNDLLLLEDSSRVWLNKNAKLTYPTHFDGETREVSLEGEAFFEVRKNQAKPFIIHSQGTNIQVLGTSFLIKSNIDSVSVSVVTGKVLFTGEKQEFTLTPGDCASLDKKSQRMQKFYSDFNHMAWHTRELKFEKTKLKDVARYLKEVYNTTFQVDAAISSCRFTGHYKNESLDQILGDIELTLQVTVTTDSLNHKVILHGKAC